MENRRRVGAAYEKQAAEYLEQRGYQILERNFRCRLGEIDLIAGDGRTLVFVEVKYRKTAAYGLPAEAVNSFKQRIISQVADYYRISHGISEAQPCRFDVVAVLGEEIALYQNAFPYQGTKG